MIRVLRTALLALLSCCLCFLILNMVLHMDNVSHTATPYRITNGKRDLENALTRQMNLRLADLQGEAAAETEEPVVLVLNDHDLIAPKPDESKFGEVSSPEKMDRILSDLGGLKVDGNMLFTTQTQIKEGSAIRYYLDETIFAVTWKQVVDDGVYTFSEVVIAHPSQFRRFFSDGSYNSKVLHTTTEMSETVNAVVASAGDYFGYRTIGIVVNEGEVFRDRGHFLDTCFIDENGDFIFSYAGELIGKEAVQSFVDEHNVRFSLCFGPVMIRDGEYCVPSSYNSGEIESRYARAALCQMGKLHYVVVTANNEEPNYNVPTVGRFAQRLLEMGVPNAYALDGGQTASIAMNNQLINSVSYGSQRKISDIFYFATAVPEGGR